MRIIIKRAAGIEPASSAWKAEVLPLNYARIILKLSDQGDLNSLITHYIITLQGHPLKEA